MVTSHTVALTVRKAAAGSFHISRAMSSSLRSMSSACRENGKDLFFSNCVLRFSFSSRCTSPLPHSIFCASFSSFSLFIRAASARASFMSILRPDASRYTVSCATSSSLPISSRLTWVFGCYNPVSGDISYEW